MHQLHNSIRTSASTSIPFMCNAFHSNPLFTLEVPPKQLRILCTESLKNEWSVKQSKSLSECLCLLKSQISFAIQKGVSRALVMGSVDARCEMDEDDDDCASVPPEDLTDEEGIDLDVDDLDWNGGVSST
jgi:hypothetical protein